MSERRPEVYEPLLEESAEELYDRAPCGYLSTLPDGTIIKVNDTFLRWTGFDRDDLVGRRRFQQLLTVGGRIYHETHYAPMLRMQGRVREIAVDLVTADGSELPVLMNSAMEVEDDGSPRVVRTTLFDATERRSYERELLRARQEAEAAAVRARELATTLQASLIPPEPPGIPGLDVAAVYRPAGRGDEVGGDFYDVFELAPEEWAVVLGDVSGKGAAAAAVTALARYTVRAIAMRARRPRAILQLLNEAVRRQHPDRFVTVLYARLELHRAPALSLTVAGHPRPLLLRADDPPEPIGTHGDLLGLWETPSLYEVRTELRPGDVVVAFTDGVTEARRGDEFFGEDRLHAALVRSRGAPASDIASGLLEDVLRFQGSDPRDDIAVVVLRVP